MTPEQEKQYRDDFDKWGLAYMETIGHVMTRWHFSRMRDYLELAYLAACKKLQKEVNRLAENKNDREIERAYLIENNTLEERCSEGSHYTWLDDENERLKSEVKKRDEFLSEAYVWVENWQGGVNDPQWTKIEEWLNKVRSLQK